jgi:hypothetical protein
MEAAIRNLVRGARKGDVLLLHYSGHGSNVPDNDGDEADRRDEILCPTDLDWKKPLRDDWLRKTFDGMRSGVNLTVIMDCCHWGRSPARWSRPTRRSSSAICRACGTWWPVESGRALGGRCEAAAPVRARGAQVARRRHRGGA